MIPKYFDISTLIFIYFCNIILYFIVFSWLILLNKTKCICHNKYKLYIQNYIIFIFAIVFISFILNEYEVINKDDIIFQLIIYIILFLQLFMVGIVFLYIKNIIKNKCSCSKQSCFTQKIDIFIILSSFIIILIYFMGARIASADS